MVVYYRHGDFHLITDIFHELYTVLIARLKSNNFDLVITSYFLSAGGRAHFRLKNKESVSQYNPNETIYEYPILMSENVILEQEKLDNNSSIRQFLDDSIHNLDSECNDANILEADENEESILYQNFKSIYSQIKKVKFESLLNSSLFDDMNEIAEKFIINLATDLKMECSEEEIHDLLIEWALSSTISLPFHFDLKRCMPVNLWKRILTHSRWKTLGTSEANCERFISRQRDVTGRHGARFNCDTMEARLQINSSSQLINMRNYETQTDEKSEIPVEY